jgi:hypothetical protein
VRPAAERGGVAGHQILPENPALLDLGNPALGDAYPVSDLLLSQASGLAYLGEAALGTLGFWYLRSSDSGMSGAVGGE